VSKLSPAQSLLLLSLAKSKAVYAFFKNAGIAKGKMSYKSYGHQFPLTPERTEAEKTRNRIVEIKIFMK
jgi:outer membrane protein OmpA-like peptidoglycan-associated protein